MADILFGAALICFLLGAIAAPALIGRPAYARMASCGGALLGSVLLIPAAAAALWNGGTREWTIPSGVPLFSWTVRLDPLSAFFTLALGIVAAAVSVFSFGYLKNWQGRKSIGLLGFFYNLLLLSLALVFTASNAFFFLLAWEGMALAAYCLVSFDHQEVETRKAGVVFLIMSHAGTGLLLLAFLILGSAAGSLGFSNFHLFLSRLPAWIQGAVFLMFLVGFGVKAGMIPLHIWLPGAHPAAPSNISALMSGIVIKAGIYGLARVFFDFFDAAPQWAGAVVLALGVLSALIGVLYALMEHDLKRLLAYHSIENIGIILIGFGSALLFRSLGHPNLAALALIAGLFHTLNHAIFKCLLFLGAGSVLHATGTRNMEKLGGLIRRMPATALFFLVGAVAISGLPPLNGFISEWLTYQALLAGFGSTTSLSRVMFPLAGSLLALTAALAAACFVKAFGITFLALPRSEAAAQAEEADTWMRTAMGILAALCVVLGLFAGWFVPVFDPITQQALGVQMSSLLSPADGFVLSAGAARSGTISPGGITVVLVLFAALPVVIWFAWGRRGKRTTGPTWDCGLPGLTAENEYTATAFSKPLRMVFSALYRPRREIQTEFEVSPYYPTAIRFETGIEPAFEKRLYDPLKERILRFSRNMRAVQAGSIHAYLAYIFVALILLLLYGARG